MERGHAILVGGAVLIVAGIAVAAVGGASFASSFLANNTVVGRTTIQPGQAVTERTDVSQLDRQLVLTVSIDKSSYNGLSPPGARLQETIVDPTGKTVSSNEFGDSFVTSVRPDVTGTYAVTITNLGTNPVSVGGTFGYMPMIGPNGQPDIKALTGGGLGMLIAGGLISVAGIVVLIVGGIITVADSRAHHKTPTSTTQGGITYRKD